MNVAHALIRAPELVIGYHGCHAQVADQILIGDAFQASTNNYDWLGTGIYFWEYAPFRAREWALQRFGDEGVVLKATLHLRNCLNLLDNIHFEGLLTAYSVLEQSVIAQGVKMPVNKKGRHMLDRIVVDRFCNELIAKKQGQFDTVRGSFPEGAPVYDGSQILSHTHVQISVRTPTCISNIEEVHFE